MATLRFLTHSETGQVRKNNQDSGYASSTMLFVADGMGGAAAGDLASAVTAQTLALANESRTGDEMVTLLDRAFTQANTKIRQLVTADPSLDGMGTTLSGAMFDGERFALIHIGDSRGYLLRDGELKRITHDHSWVQSLIDEGRITVEQAEKHPHRSLILRVINGHPSNEADYEIMDAHIGDRVMFCSDGLSDMVNDATLHDVLAGDDLAEVAATLAERANAAGGVDNITFVIADVVEDAPAAPPSLVGSAAIVDVPDLTLATDVTPTTQPEDDEEQRYAPSTKRFRWLGTTLVLLLAFSLTTLGGWAGVSYVQSKFFVGEASNNVAIYRGIPGEIVGFSLNSVVERAATSVDDLPKFYRAKVKDGIPVADINAARTTAQQLHGLAIQCIHIREQRKNQPSPTPEPTTQLPSLSPSPSAGAPSAGPTPSDANTPTTVATPYPNDPVDPEDC